MPAAPASRPEPPGTAVDEPATIDAIAALVSDYRRGGGDAHAVAERLADTGITADQLRAILTNPDTVRDVTDPLHRTQLAAELADRAAHQRKMYSAIRTEALHQAVLDEPSGVAGVARRLGRQRQSVSREFNDRSLLAGAVALLDDMLTRPAPPKKGRRS